MAGLPGLPPPGFSERQDGPTQITIGMSGNRGLPGLPPPGFSEQQQPEQPQTPKQDYSLLNEALGIKNSLVSGLGSLGDLGQTVVKYATPGGMADNLARQIFSAPEKPSVSAQFQDTNKLISEAFGTTGEEKAQTALGKVGEGVAYYAPNMLLPGGLTKPALQSTLAAGLASGTARANNASEGAQALAGALGGLAPDALRLGARGLSSLVGGEDAGLALRRKSFGATAADYRKTADEARSFNLPEEADQVETLTKRVLNEFTTNDTLGKTRNPAKMVANLDAKHKDATERLWQGILSAESSKAKTITPQFSRAEKYLNSGKIDATQIDSKLSELENLKSMILEKGKGALPFLHNQRVAWGGKWEQGNKALNGFNRAVYQDLNDTLRAAIPNYKNINQELQAYEVVRPILEKGLTRQEATTPITKVIEKLKTTGGQLTTPTVIGGVIGGSVGGPIGLGAGVALGSLVEPKGMDRLGRAIIAGSKSSPKAASVLGSTANLSRMASDAPKSSASDQESTTQAEKSSVGKSQLKPVERKSLITPRDDSGRFIKHTSANLKSTQAKIRTALLESSDQINGNIIKGRSMTKDPKIAAIEAKIDADPVDSTIFEMESGRNWQAKNPNSTASGGFQLIKATAKALGVTDVFDPEQNYEGYLKLKKEADRLATKPEDYYAVHFLGAPTFKKWKNGGYLNEQQQEQVDFLESKLIPKFKRIYAQKLKNKSGMVEA